MQDIRFTYKTVLLVYTLIASYQKKKKSKKAILFRTASKRIKSLGINLTMVVKILYSESYKTLMKETEDNKSKWNFSSVQLSHSVVFDSLQPHGPQHAGPPCTSLAPGACSNSCPSSHWCHPTITSSVVTFSSCLRSFPASGSYQMSQFFPPGGQSIGVTASVSVLQWAPRTDLLEDGLVGSPCSPKDSQEFSPTAQFKSINSSVFSFLYSPTLTSIHDYWKNHSLDQTDLCWQSNVSAF